MEKGKPILIFCGLMGCGKTTLSKYYIKELLDYERFNTDDVRKILGKKTFDRKDTSEVNAYMYSRARVLINEGKGVLFDSAYKLANARERIYEIGRELNVPVLVVECVCLPETSINRISARPKKQGEHSPTNDAEVYREYSKIWEGPELDLEKPENAHVSLIKINTDENKLEEVKLRENGSIVDVVEFLKEKLEELQAP